MEWGTCYNFEVENGIDESNYEWIIHQGKGDSEDYDENHGFGPIEYKGDWKI